MRKVCIQRLAFALVTVLCGRVCLAEPAENEADRDPQIEAVVSSGNERTAFDLSASIETLWNAANPVPYCHKINSLVDQTTKMPATTWRIKLLQEVSIKALTKLSVSQGAPEAVIDCAVTTVLQTITYSRNASSLGTDDFAHIRSLNAAVALSLLQSLQKQSIPKYVHQPVSPNIAPPPGVPGFAGMKPEAIKDPTERQTYIDALDQNNKHNLENMRQHALKLGLFRCEKTIRRYLIDAYNQAPANMQELKSKLDDAGYTPQQQQNFIGNTQVK